MASRPWQRTAFGLLLLSWMRPPWPPRGSAQQDRNVAALMPWRCITSQPMAVTSVTVLSDDLISKPS
jgi:hypothetical protein